MGIVRVFCWNSPVMRCAAQDDVGSKLHHLGGFGLPIVAGRIYQPLDLFLGEIFAHPIHRFRRRLATGARRSIAAQ
jgi:hypothetical protein